MKSLLTTGLAAIAIAFLALAATTALQAETLQSLRGSQAIDEAEVTPEVNRIVEGDMQRSFRQQPPMIPHKVDKYEIDLKVNQCLRCHEFPYAKQENAPQISETHYENREGVDVGGIKRRWFCTQCHAPQTDAKPLVENVFDSGLR